MDRGGNEGVTVADYLACADFVPFCQRRFAYGADMLREHDGYLLRVLEELDRAVFGKMFISRRVNTFWKGYFGFCFDLCAPLYSQKFLFLPNKRFIEITINTQTAPATTAGIRVSNIRAV